MKRIVIPLLVGLAMGAGAVWFVQRPHAPESSDAGPAPVRETADPNLLAVDAATQARIGLVVEPLTAIRAPMEVRGDARVLDASLLLQQGNDLAVARLARDASRREWERLKILFAQGQAASARALEAGEAAEKRDEALAQAAETRLLANWGAVLAERTDLPEVARQLARFEAALVRMEFPLGVAWEGAPKSASVTWLSDPDRPMSVEWLGQAPTTDALTQGRAFLGLVRTNGLVPGTSLTVRVATDALPRDGVLVPSSAILRHDGGTFVFGVVDSDHFRRIPVILSQPSTRGWLVTSGLTNGQRVVMTGAQALLSAEQKPRGGDE